MRKFASAGISAGICAAGGAKAGPDATGAEKATAEGAELAKPSCGLCVLCGCFGIYASVLRVVVVCPMPTAAMIATINTTMPTQTSLAFPRATE